MPTPKLLIIDDDPAILDSFSQLLSLHFEVNTSNTVESGISRLESNEYAVAIIDMHFSPDDAEGGMRIIEYMVKNELATKGIVLTAHGNIDNCRAAMKEGVFDYVEKGQPQTEDLLLTAALVASKAPPQITIELSGENIEILSELQEAINTDQVGIIREGIRLLNWAINEWKQGRRIASIKDLKLKIYPNLIREGEN